ncbi:P-loop NTPase [Sediminibacillus dalangtanensis]|uniref:P-loop NTPase n=1 Tax=Sediminibacillus dalangtanensis TaxID=2729421 RepID=A0ABX7VUH7_9BACI|nr:MinD/ParA family protein [Sediminibacillus dalangtanensis]QTM99430.1 P-loop NTPase [Sediminibacillus dalangtanensis]
MYDQAANLRRKVEATRNPKQAKTIAVVSGKGGVGKSNFALNFCLSLSKKQKKVLLFDLDIGMGNIDVLLGKTSKLSIVDMFEEQLPIQDVIEQVSDSFAYISAGSGLTNIFAMDNEQFDYFINQYELLTGLFDFIIFDMGAGITEGSANFLMAVDEAIVVTTPEPTSLTDAYAMIKHITREDLKLPLFLLINRIPNQRIGKQTAARLQRVAGQFLGKELAILGMLPEDKAVVQAVISQTPFIEKNPKTAAAKAVREMTDMFLDGDRPDSRRTSSSFIKKLTHFIKER